MPANLGSGSFFYGRAERLGEPPLPHFERLFGCRHGGSAKRPNVPQPLDPGEHDVRFDQCRKSALQGLLLGSIFVDHVPEPFQALDLTLRELSREPHGKSDE